MLKPTKVFQIKGEEDSTSSSKNNFNKKISSSNLVSFKSLPKTSFNNNTKKTTSLEEEYEEIVPVPSKKNITRKKTNVEHILVEESISTPTKNSITTTLNDIISNNSALKKSPSNSSSSNYGIRGELCDERDRLKDELKIKRKEYDNLVTECENEIYGKFTNKYFKKINSNKGLTHIELLNGLRNYYTHKKQQDSNFILRFKDFIDMFPRDRAVQNSNYKKQHVFEAMCRLLLLLNYDNGELGKKKGFYGPLGEIEKSKKITTEEILNSSINEGNKAGLVDILFQIEKIGEKNINNLDRWACDYPKSNNNNGINIEEKEYILIQNKYYDKEKSNLNNYDVARIYALADYKNKLAKANGENPYSFKIVLMVNNQEALSENLERVKEKYNIIYKIYGTAQIDEWFQQMLYELYESKIKNISLDNFIENKGHIKELKPILQPRFHQEFFTNTTLSYFNNGYKKFIWGAVPRSGKSFMIGNTISKLKEIEDNDILIILGAKTETQSQFIDDLFKKYANFANYNIVISDELKEKISFGLGYIGNRDENKKTIFLVSQQWFKNQKIDTEETYITSLKKIKNTVTSQFNLRILSLIKQVLKTQKIYLFFDEIHKGGSTDNSESILFALKNAGYIIDIFIMVTATFAKPNIRYKDNFIDNKETQIVEWSYEDQQNMKEVNDETKKQMFINSRKEKQIQLEELQKLFNLYQDRYGSEYLSILSNEYKKHPELVLIEPETILEKGEDLEINIDDVRAIMIGNLSCNACIPNNDFNYYIDYKNIFNNPEPVINLLQYISNRTNINSIYNYFKNVLNYPITASHTELWFLPDKDLYLNPQDCDKCKNISLEDNNDEDLIIQTGKNTGKTIEQSLANIEPLTRGLALIMKGLYGFERYNIFIVHGTDLSYLSRKKSLKTSIKDYLASIGIKLYDKTQGSLRDQIKQFEIDTYRHGKSLIILTGGSLRLGISLPCVDIAFNFDDIKSLDNNYQTMFRVLTERPNKKYGYYIDFNKDRAKTFLYEYNNIYGSGRLKNTSKDKVESLQALLFTFNYNGLNLGKQDSLKEVNLYEDLINNLELSEVNYVDYWSKLDNIQKVIKKALGFSGNMELLKELNNYLDKINKFEKKVVKSVIKEGESMTTSHIIDPNKKEKENEDEEEVVVEPDNTNYMEILNKLAMELPSIIMLFGLFSDENNINCNNLEQCINNSIVQLKRNPNYCSCKTLNDPETHIFDCFQNSPENVYGKFKYTKEKLALYLIVINELLYNEKYRLQTELLRTNLEFIFDNIRRLMKNKSNALIYDMDSAQIKEKIEQYLPVRKVEKDKFGEVFTPEELIEEMLIKLPNSVWSNPDLKWLDPANGIGNFPMIVYKILMEGYSNSKKKIDGLKNVIKDPVKRRKHIIENMLYMIEINPKNIKISEKIFGKNANICCADFLNETEKCFKKFGVDKFDVIIGNPPFQDERVEDKTGPKQGGVNKLYERITVKCIDILTNNGYLLFVTPDNIFSGNSNKTYKEFLNYNVLLVNLNNINSRFFNNVKQSMCYFLINKSKNNKETIIINNTNQTIKIKLKDRASNPLKEWTTINENLINNYISEFQNGFIRSNSNSPPYNRDGKIVVKVNSNEEYKTNDINAQGYKVPKFILFRMQPTKSGILDSKGEYALANDQLYYLPLEEFTIKQQKMLETFFNSEIYNKLVKLTTTSQFLKDAFIKHLNINKILGKKSNKIVELIEEDSNTSSNSDNKSKTKKKATSSSKGGFKRKTKKH